MLAPSGDLTTVIVFMPHCLRRPRRSGRCLGYQTQTGRLVGVKGTGRELVWAEAVMIVPVVVLGLGLAHVGKGIVDVGSGEVGNDATVFLLVAQTPSHLPAKQQHDQNNQDESTNNDAGNGAGMQRLLGCGGWRRRRRGRSVIEKDGSRCGVVAEASGEQLCLRTATRAAWVFGAAAQKWYVVILARVPEAGWIVDRAALWWHQVVGASVECGRPEVLVGTDAMVGAGVNHAAANELGGSVMASIEGTGHGT